MERIRRENSENDGRRVCLDTNIPIEIIRGSPQFAHLREKYARQTPVIASITVFELLMRRTNLAEVEVFIANSDILYFDEKSARIASSIAKHLKEKGIVIPAHDLFIAATAISNNCELLTLNKKDFEHIEGLKLVDM